MKKVYIVKGTPGSGKSKMAESLVEIYSMIGVIPHVIEAKDFMISEVTGKYEYIYENVKKSFSSCLAKYNSLIESNVEVIIVTNVNGHISEYGTYIQKARSVGYEVFVMCMENHHDGKPSESVPEKQFLKILRKFKSYPSGIDFYNAEKKRKNENTKIEHPEVVTKIAIVKSEHKPSTMMVKTQKPKPKFSDQNQNRTNQNHVQKPVRSFVRPTPTVKS